MSLLYPSICKVILPEESQYTDLLHKIIKTGVKKPNRTNTPTYSIFGNTMTFSLSSENGLIVPLLTTKKMNYRLIVEELLWFLSGSTDAKILHDKDVKIWDENSSRKTLDMMGFEDKEEGDCGPIYGWQYRHFGAEYKTCKTDYTGQGIDQIENLLENLSKDPYSRRHIITSWDPSKLYQMCLAPCHLMCQFNVDPVDQENPNGEKYIDCAVFQRSADVPLGVPFNIASYATFTHIIAQMVNMTPRKLQYFTGDTHIYENQMKGCKEQITRIPFKFPHLTLKSEKNIRDYKWENFTLHEYECHELIKFPFSV